MTENRRSLGIKASYYALGKSDRHFLVFSDRLYNSKKNMVAYIAHECSFNLFKTWINMWSHDKIKFILFKPYILNAKTKINTSKV